MNNLVGDVKANPRDFYRYINSQKKDTQGVPFFLSLYTATRPHGHSRQVGAASVSIRQKKLKYSKE